MRRNKSVVVLPVRRKGKDDLTVEELVESAKGMKEGETKKFRVYLYDHRARDTASLRSKLIIALGKPVGVESEVTAECIWVTATVYHTIE